MRESASERKLRHRSRAGRAAGRKALVHYHRVTLVQVRIASSRRRKRLLARERRQASAKISPVTAARMTQLLTTYAAP